MSPAGWLWEVAAGMAALLALRDAGAPLWVAVVGAWVAATTASLLHAAVTGERWR